MGGSEVKQGLPSRCSRVGTALPLAINMDRESASCHHPLYKQSHFLLAKQGKVTLSLWRCGRGGIMAVLGVSP